MLHTINGLPAHVLLIHAIVVLGPLGALFTGLSAVWPKARRRIGVYGPVTCLVVLILTPITTNAGEWLEDKLTKGQPANSEFVERIHDHADLGDTFLFFAIGLFVLSAAVWWVGRISDAATPTDAVEPVGGGTATLTRTPATTRVPAAVQYAVAVLAVLVSVATVVQLLRIGDSGASAAWKGVVSGS